MEVNLAVLADYASITQDNKLNIMGVFGEINPPMLPFALPSMFLVIVFEAPPAEIGQTKALQVSLLNSDGKEMLRLENQAVVSPPARPGSHVLVNAVLGFNMLTFLQSGDYQFSILVNGEQKRAVPLRVNEPIKPAIGE